MASTSAGIISAALTKYLRRRNATIGRDNNRPARACITREVLPMSEVIPFPPKPPPKSIQEETAEFLQLLERIRSQSQKSK
jgi:hypothetical protein